MISDELLSLHHLSGNPVGLRPSSMMNSWLVYELRPIFKVGWGSTLELCVFDWVTELICSRPKHSGVWFGTLLVGVGKDDFVGLF